MNLILRCICQIVARSLDGAEARTGNEIQASHRNARTRVPDPSPVLSQALGSSAGNCSQEQSQDLNLGSWTWTQTSTAKPNAHTWTCTPLLGFLSSLQTRYTSYSFIHIKIQNPLHKTSKPRHRTPAGGPIIQKDHTLPSIPTAPAGWLLPILEHGRMVDESNTTKNPKLQILNGKFLSQNLD